MIGFDSETTRRILHAVRKVETLPPTLFIPQRRFPRGAAGGSSGGAPAVSEWKILAEITRWKRIASAGGGNQWLYYFREIGIAADGTRGTLENPLTSETIAVLNQSQANSYYARITSTPTPGSVLQPNVDDEILFEWEAASQIQEAGDEFPVSAVGYRLLIGTTLGGSDIYNGTQTTSLSYTLDAGDLPDTGATVYVTLMTLYPDDRWRENAYTYAGKASVLHLAVNTRELSSVPHGTGVQCNGVREWGYSFPSRFRLQPIGGGQYPWPTPAGGTEYGKPLNYTVVEIKKRNDVSGQSRYEFSETNNHGDDCTSYPYPKPNNTDYAILQSPECGSQLSGASVTFSWNSITDAVEYWLQISDTYGGSNLYNASTALNTSVTVSGLPTDDDRLWVRVWTKFADEPGWYYNECQVTASSPA